MFAFVFFALAALIILTVLVVLIRAIAQYRNKAREAGFSSLGEYLRAIPVTDSEKQDAIDLALKGLVVCVLGLVVPPLLLLGVFPLYFGARKIAYCSMGLGLFEDADLSN